MSHAIHDVSVAALQIVNISSGLGSVQGMKDAIGGCVVRIRWFGGNNGQFTGKGERMNTADEGFIFGGELTDLWHDKSPMVAGFRED